MTWARRRDEILIAAALAALACAMALGGWGWRLDRLVYDFGLSLWAQPAPPGIVIVAIDDPSIEAIGRWPWRRAVHATLLQLMRRATPKAVLLDLTLSEPEPDPAQDLLLAQALRASGRVVLPVAWRGGSGAPLAAIEPLEVLRDGAVLGTAEPTVDDDGVLRSAFLHAGPQTDAGPRYPHVALALLQRAGEAPSPQLQLDAEPMASPGSGSWRRSGRLLVRYAGPPGTVTRVSYVDLLRGTVAPERLSGQYVLIGMTAQGVGDTLATPVNGRHSTMPGIEVLANVLYTLQGHGLIAFGDTLVAALSAVLLAILLLAFGRWDARTALPLALGSVPLAIAGSVLALRAGWWCSPLPYALPALLAYPLWSWRRLEGTVRSLDGEIAHLAREPLLSGAAAWPAPARGDAIDARLQTLRDAGAAIRQARDFLGETLATLPIAVLVADAHAHVLLANARAAALFAIDDPAEARGLDLARLLGEFGTTAPLDWRAALAALGDGAEAIAIEARSASGGEYLLHAAAVGASRRVVAIADVAAIKAAQREREETLAFVSHDLRSPASAIVLLADLGLAGRAERSNEELLREVRRLASRTLELSEDFVRVSLLRTRELQKSAVAPAALVDEALADLRPQALTAGVALQVDPAAASDGAAAWVDAALVARALANLVSNAIKHSPRGGKVLIGARLQDARLRLRVADEGPGLAAAQRAQLERGDQGAAVGDARGIGLGLLFVQRVAARHGGRLQLLPPVAGAGACFEIELPASGNP